MTLGNAIKILRQTAFLTQEEFASILKVAPSTVNRWEVNKVKPNVKAMKEIKKFCEDNQYSYEDVEKAWINAMMTEGATRT